MDLSGAQTGDINAGNVAGRDHVVVNDLAALARLLEGQAHERALVAASIEHLSNQLDAHELMQSRRDAADTAERHARQRRLDLLLATLIATVAVLALLVAWLLWREAAAMAARAVFDSVLARR